MSFLTYDTADDIITSLEIIEKLLFPETEFWRDNYLKQNFFGLMPRSWFIQTNHDGDVFLNKIHINKKPTR